ncbi:MAG: hypothetical protein QOC99_234 [Acidobacteriota bacterium]|jgi:hypothetical protein|nr:hypothetical protein [Acidobacteriota bacterium]
MRTLLLLPLLLSLVPTGQSGAVSDDGSSAVTVLGFKWSKSRQTNERPVATSASSAPAAAMIPANKNFERNRRINDPAGVRDPNADTIDGRSAALEKSVQESRSPKSEPVDVYAYRARVRNAGAKPIEVLFWEYQFKESANPRNVVRRQFLCGVQIKPDKEKELQANTLAGPDDVISVESLAKHSANLYQEKVVINRVEYADGSIWQRKDWNFAEVRQSIARAVSTPWGVEMCRGL